MSEQQRHLPSASTAIELHAAIAVGLQYPWGNSEWSEAVCAPGNLVGQVFRQLDAFRNRFYYLNPCIFSYLEKHWIPSWLISDPYD